MHYINKCNSDEFNEMLIESTFEIKSKSKNTTLSEQFLNPIEK
jgi:hypothetical protein